MLWSKHFYHYVVKDWPVGDPGDPPAPQERQKGRNREWTHLYNADVVSMPDKWEYPWYMDGDVHALTQEAFLQVTMRNSSSKYRRGCSR